MMVIDYLNELEKNGLLNKLIRCGVIAHTFQTYKEIYAEFIFHTSKGKKKMQVYTLLAENYAVSELTVMNAIKIMQLEDGRR